jgi:mono/diheme cytochrome c family protein
MKQARGRNTLIRSFSTLIIAAAFAAGVATAQVGQAVNFSMPYEFVVGARTLPAGNYTFSLSQKESFRLAVRSEKVDQYWVNIVSALAGPNELFRGGYLVFEKSDKAPVLSEVWISGMNGALIHSIAKGHGRFVVSGTSLDDKHTYSGEAAYSKTCASCHGEKGTGDAAADKFFAVKIPRLASPEVQSKPDEELRKQITEGSGKMAPVEVDESGFRHRLPPKDVDAVIDYIRTLKK